MYIELVVIEDLFFNYITLMCVGILLNRITKFKKVFLASVIGTINLIFLLLNSNLAITFITSILFSMIMSIISFKYKDLIYTLKNITYMYLSSIFLGGGINLINTYFLYNIESQFLYIIILFIFSPLVTYSYIKGIKSIKINHSKYYKLNIYLFNQEKIEVSAFLDTGNKLTDPYTHKPIILLKKSLVKEKNQKKIFVPYNTVNNHSLLECIIPDKITIEKVGEKNKLLIGLVDEINIEGIDCILNEKLL